MQKKNNKKGNGVTKEVRQLKAASSNKEFGKITISRFPGIGFPDQLRITLKFQVNNIQLTGSNSPATLIFNANSTFAPYPADGDLQPLYYQQLIQLYNQYCVQAIEAHAQVGNSTGTSGFTLDVAHGYYDSDVSAFDVPSLAVGRWAKSSKVSASTGTNSKIMKLPPASTRNIQGQKDLIDDPNNYASVSANPVDLVYYMLRVATTGTATATAYVNVTLFQDVWFKELQLSVPELIVSDDEENKLVEQLMKVKLEKANRKSK